jgi:diguanylate cyclase (GGDEF)-like protein
LYLPYLMCGYAATVLMMLAGCFAILRTMPGLPGLRLMIGSLFSGLAGVSLLALRLIAPAWVTIVLANGAIMSCALLMFSATLRILDRRAPYLRWSLAVLGTAVAGLCYFTYIHQSLVARIYICSGCFAVYAIARAVVLFQFHEPDADQDVAHPALRPLIGTLAWLHVSIAALQAARIVLTALYPPTQIVHMDIIQSGFTYLNLVLNAGVGFGLIWLAQAIHRKALQRIAQTDSLTGLLNRRAFEEILLRELLRSQHGGAAVSLLQVDIDRFKQVNDTWGHQAGDEVIREVAFALRDNLRPGDSLSRYGGEEFMILLREASADQSAEIAGRLRAGIAALAGLPGNIRLTVSIGVAANHPFDTPEALLRRCDEALYLSKKGGRNRVTVHRAPPALQSSATVPASA